MRDFGIDFSPTRLFLARLVRITRLDGYHLRIAEAETSITIDTETFRTMPGCVISAVKHIINGDMPSMEITFAPSFGGTIGTYALNNGIWDGARVQVYIVNRGSLPSSLSDPLFTGVVDTVNLDPIGSIGSWDIRGLAAQAEAFIQTYQPMCRTDLGSPLCQVDLESLAQTGTVDTIIDRFNFTVAGLASPPADGWFNQGTLITPRIDDLDPSTGFKAVIANWDQGALQVTTFQPKCIANLTAGQDVKLYPGCDKLAATCKNKFNNKINFQGEDHFLGIKSILGV